MQELNNEIGRSIKMSTPMSGDHSYWQKTNDVMKIDAQIKEHQEQIKILMKQREKLAIWTLENDVVRFGYEMAMEKLRGAE